MQTQPRKYTVEYTHPKAGVHYMADFEHTKKSDFTNDKTKAMPMTRQHADLSVIRAIYPAKVVPI